MEPQLREGLKRVRDLVDAARLRDAERLQDDVWAWKPVERIPVVMHGIETPEWPLYPYDETFENPEKMLWNQLQQPYIGASLRDDRMLTVRPNHGLAIIPSLFGATVHVDSQTTWVEGCHDAAAVRRIIDRGVPDLEAGLGKRVFETIGLYRGWLDDAGLRDFVHIFQADTQSPFDCAYLLWGHEIYLAMTDEPETVHALLDLVTETTVRFVRRMKAVMQEPPDRMYHWWYRVPAAVRVVDDVSINLSPAMYDEFNRPYNERLFAAFGAGYMHYCGNGLHAQQSRVMTRGLRGVEMGSEFISANPDFTLERICRQAAERRVTICWIAPGMPEARPDIATGLVFGHIARLPLPAALERLGRVKAFWMNR